MPDEANYEGLIREIAGLVRIKLSDEEVAKLARDYAGFREHAEKLKEVDTSDVQPSTYTRMRGEKLRPDVAKLGLNHDLFFKNVPVRDGNYVKVPRVLEYDE